MPDSSYTQDIRLSGVRVSGVAYATVVLQSAPEVYYRLGESSGTTAVDSVPNARNGTYTGGVTLAQSGALAGDVNSSASFDGTDDYISTPYTFNSTNHSVEFWLNTAVLDENPSVNDYRSIISRSSQANWVLQEQSGRISFRSFDSSQANFTSNALLAINTWYHVVCTWDGTNRRIYINGNLDNTSAPESGTPPSGTVEIGRAYGSNSVDRNYEGRLDEIAIYNYVLSADVIKAHYEAGTSPSARGIYLTGRETSTVERDIRLTAEDSTSTEVGIYWDAIGVGIHTQALHVTGELSTLTTCDLCITGRGYSFRQVRVRDDLMKLQQTHPALGFPEST